MFSKNSLVVLSLVLVSSEEIYCSKMSIPISYSDFGFNIGQGVLFCFWQRVK